MYKQMQKENEGESMEETFHRVIKHLEWMNSTMDITNSLTVDSQFMRYDYYNFFYLQEEHAVSAIRLDKDEKLGYINIKIKKVHADLKYSKEEERVSIKVTNYDNA